MSLKRVGITATLPIRLNERAFNALGVVIAKTIEATAQNTNPYGKAEQKLFPVD